MGLGTSKIIWSPKILSFGKRWQGLSKQQDKMKSVKKTERFDKLFVLDDHN